MEELGSCPAWPFLEPPDLCLQSWDLEQGSLVWQRELSLQLRLLDWAEEQEGISWRPREGCEGRGETLGTDF